MAYNKTFAAILFAFGGSMALANAQAQERSSANPSLPPPQITRQIDEANLVVLTGNTRPEAKISANDRGIVSDSFPMPHMLLQLRRSAAQEQAVNNLIDQLHDRNSPNFHRWLRPAQVGTLFGPADSDIKTVTDRLQQHGFTVNGVYPNRLVIDYSGTAGQVREAFHTEIHNISVDGAAHFANMTDPQIPAALAPLVAGPVSLHDFRPRSHLSNAGCPGGWQATSNCYPVVPSDLWTIYNFTPVFNSGITGYGETIYLIEDSQMGEADYAEFREKYGLNSYLP